MLRQSQFLAAGLAFFLMAATAAAQDQVACTLPGERVAEDATGDATTGLNGHDVEAVFVGEPDSLQRRLAVTLKLVDLQPEAPPNSIYYVMFGLDDGAQYFFSYDPYDVAASPGTIGVFEYGHTEVGAGGVNSLVSDGIADPESSASADGSITWVLTKDKIAALPESAEMFNIKGEARALIGAAGRGLVTVVDDSPSGFYALNACGGDSKGFLLGGGFGLTLLLPFALAALRRRAFQN